MEMEDDIDLDGPYVGLELSKDTKITWTRGVVGSGDVALRQGLCYCTETLQDAIYDSNYLVGMKLSRNYNTNIEDIA
jgi:hypothetical protein